MRKLSLLSLLVLIAFNCFPQQEEDKPEVYALVVGISQYNYIKPLSFADSDAELFVELLRSGAGGRIKPENLFFFKNGSANAGNFWSSFSRICNKNLKKGDRVYIYFAGHGDGIKGLNEYYLLLSDCQPGNDGNNYLLSFGAIDMYNLKNRMGLLTTKGVEVILILDACRTNELAGGYASQVFSTSILQTRVGEIAMLATGPGQVSIENASFGNGHGLFTYTLVDAFSGRADSEESGNRDQRISFDELQNWVTKNVSSMASRFRTNQTPVFCCSEKNQLTLGIVDSSFTLAWNKKKGFTVGSDTSIRTNASREANVNADTALLLFYQQFIQARKENRLWGEQSSDYYYERMKAISPTNSLTDDARYQLASDFINFAQQKINLYLEGKDLLSIEIMREKSDSLNEPTFLEQEYDRLRKTISEGWTIAGLMVQKASALLSVEGDSTIFMKLKPKVSFLLARGYLNEEKESTLTFEQALAMAQEAYMSDSSAAYIAECLGLLYNYRHTYSYYVRTYPGEGFLLPPYRPDTVLRYFRKALELAPKWVNAYRNIAMKAYHRWYIDSAGIYLQKAISLDPGNASSYIMYADYIRYRYPDSANHYYKVALKFAPRSAHSDIYQKISSLFFRYPIDSLRGTPKYWLFRRAKYDSLAYYARRSLSLDSMNTGAYLNLASMFQFRNMVDSSVYYYEKVTKLFPHYEYPYNELINLYTQLKKPDSVLYYSRRLLGGLPGNGNAYFSIAVYYDNKPGYVDSAFHYYNLALKANTSNDVCREKIAYIIMSRDKHDTLPLHYFKLMSNQPAQGWRQDYNMACYYANSGDTGKAMEYLSITLSKGMRQRQTLAKDPFLESIRGLDEFKALLKKYNLD